jgi:hypothetical protein
MNTMRAGTKREVNTIVDQQLHPVSRGDSDGRLCLLVKLARSQTLLTKLNKRRTAVTQQFDLFSVRKSRQLHIRQRVNAW